MQTIGLVLTDMVTLKLILDTRRAKADGKFPLKIHVSHQRKVKYISLNICLSPQQWNNADCLVTSKHTKYRVLNTKISDVFEKAFWIAADMTFGSKGSMVSVNEICDAICKDIFGVEPKKKKITFAEILEKFANLKKKESTAELYRFTLARMRAFDANVDFLTCEDITLEWLTRFDEFMTHPCENNSTSKIHKTTSQNYRNIQFRNIRAVFNYAIDEGLTTFYPFRRFKIKPVETEKMSLNVEQLRLLFDYPVEKYQRIYVDMFKLIFFLCGINSTLLFEHE